VWDNWTRVLDPIELVREIRIHINCLSSRVRRKVVLQIAQSAKDGCMPSIFGDGYSDGFFSTSRADKHSGEFLLDDADYSTSSSPQ